MARPRTPLKQADQPANRRKAETRADRTIKFASKEKAMAAYYAISSKLEASSKYLADH